jgi:hypothetical protein
VRGQKEKEIDFYGRNVIKQTCSTAEPAVWCLKDRNRLPLPLLSPFVDDKTIVILTNLGRENIEIGHCTSSTEDCSRKTPGM